MKIPTLTSPSPQRTIRNLPVMNTSLDSPAGMPLRLISVLDLEGKLIATFTSIWRLEESNHWRNIFDKGNPVSIKGD